MSTLLGLNTRVGEAVLAKSENLAVTVIGAGNSARALSAYLTQNGHSVSLMARSTHKIPGIVAHKRIVASGKLEGEFKLVDVGSEARALIPSAEVIFVATVTSAYGDVARSIAPYLTGKQKIVLFSGKLGGVLEFSTALGPKCAQTPVLETDALFACRAQEDESIWIRGHKKWTLFSGVNRSSTMEHKGLINSFFPGLDPASNIIERGLTDFGAAAHAPIVLANMNKIDRAEPFLFYYEGLTERTIAILSAVEVEFGQIAAAYGASLIPLAELLNRYYGCDTSSLYEAIRTVPNYRHSQAPNTLDHRFLIEDVSCTLVPAQQFARLAGVKTPTIDAVITFASLLTGIDCATTGRTLVKLGLENCDYKGLNERLNA